MNRITSLLFRKIESPIRIGAGYDYVWKGEDLVVSPKTSFAAGVLVSLLLGALFAVPALFVPIRTHGDQIGQIGAFVFAASLSSSFVVLAYFRQGETRLNRRAIEFHYYHRRKNRPKLLYWKDVECLRMTGHGWAFRGNDAKAFVPYGNISADDWRLVDGFLKELLSPDFDLTTKPIPGKKFFLFGCAPLIGIFAIMACAMGFIRLYLTHPIFRSIIPPIVVFWLLWLWSLVVLGLFITHGVILNRQANKDKSLAIQAGGSGKQNSRA